MANCYYERETVAKVQQGSGEGETRCRSSDHEAPPKASKEASCPPAAGGLDSSNSWAKGQWIYEKAPKLPSSKSKERTSQLQGYLASVRDQTATY